MPYEHEKPWKPFSPGEIVSLFRSAIFPWWIAGGLAIEHFVRRRLRPHADIDVLVLRKDVTSLRRYLNGWDCWAADPPGHLRVWHVDEVLGDNVHDVWCRQDSTSPWSFQIMIDESNGSEWYSRRCHQVRKPLEEMGVSDDQGGRFLSPEIQLFYKASSPRPKDELDFEASLPLLAPTQKAWLLEAIERAYGSTNVWADRLRTLISI